MNKRIRELAEQALFESDFDDEQNIKITVGIFAELIVREVFAKIEDERFEVYEPVKEAVMKHFGVEE